MNKAFEKIIERLEAESFERRIPVFTERAEMVIDFETAKQIVQEAAEEYSYLSKGFNNGLLKRIADYFSSVYEGDDKTAPKMELSVYDLRYIASLNVEKCRLQTEINNIKKSHEKYNNGWIPCSERLPEDDSICIVTVEYPNNKTIVDYGWFDRKSVCWFVGMQEFRTSNILAWQPLPEPYNERD